MTKLKAYRKKKVKDFAQFDTRWGSLRYKGPGTMRANGCGPTACADIIAAVKPKYTPKNSRKWLIDHGYATPASGTYISGIKPCLEANGLKYVKIYGSMSDFWRDLQTHRRVGIILFRGGKAPDGTIWTGGGHFVSFSGFKIMNGKHYLWINDPGPRHHNGGGRWYCYEKSMKGLIVNLWSCRIPRKKKKTPAKKNNTVTKFLTKLAVNFNDMKQAGYIYRSSGNALSWKKSKRKRTSNCATYVCYTLQRMGLLPSTGYFYGSGGKIRFRGNLSMVDLGKIADVKFFDKRPSKCDLQPGDIVTYKNPAHTQVYAGKNKRGDLLWYSWTRSNIKHDAPRKNAKYNTKKIQHRIRLK